MKLAKLQLENFRNYESLSHNFNVDNDDVALSSQNNQSIPGDTFQNNDLIILLGPNGKGKTNFLEAIFMLSLGKSFRSGLQDDLLNWNSDYFRVSGQILIDDEKIDLEVFYSGNPIKKKNFKKNDVNLKNSEFIGNFLTVLFQPEDLNILYLSPSLRRRYMDVVLSQTDKGYISALINYNKALKQRNALLKDIREKRFKNLDTKTLLEDLDAWDSEIIQFAKTIQQTRNEFVDFLNKRLQKIYQSISSANEKILVKYQKSASSADSLSKIRQKDIILGKSTIGPHRDDLVFFIDEKNILSCASRGEFRTLLLAIKIAEIDFIKEKTGQNPVLLLDDVFSELDPERQKKLISSIKNCQTIITATELENLGNLTKKAAIIT